MTIEELIKIIGPYPGDATVYITFPDDEVTPLVVTYDVKHKIMRLCKNAEEISYLESVIEDRTAASGRGGVGA